MRCVGCPGIGAKQQRLALCNRDRADLLGQRAPPLSNRPALMLLPACCSSCTLSDRWPALPQSPRSHMVLRAIFAQNLLLRRHADLQADRSGLAGVPWSTACHPWSLRSSQHVARPKFPPGSVKREDCRCAGQPSARGYEIVAPPPGQPMNREHPRAHCESRRVPNNC